MGKTINYDELPDSITPKLYAMWRGISVSLARQKFHSDGFPLIPNMGSRLIADKRDVFLYETTEKFRPYYATEFAKKMI